VADPAPVTTAPITPVTPAVVAAQASGGGISRRGKVGVGIAVVFALGAISSVQKPASDSPLTSAPPDLAIVNAPTSTPTFRPTPTPAPTFGPGGPTTEARVVRVTDGDTIVVEYDGQEYKVRYIGMDAPETVDPDSPIGLMGPEASTANGALVEGKTVYLEKDVSEIDSFGRLLRYVWVTDGAAWTLVNLELVRQGFASAKSYPPDIRYDGLYVEGQESAQQSAIGLWSAPEVTPAPTPKPTPKATPKPTPKPTAKPKPASKCHPSYEPCLPIVGDLDCADIRAMGKDPVDVIGPDDYRLDRDGDGLGCE
jgi:micrococcal nuclease